MSKQAIKPKAGPDVYQLKRNLALELGASTTEQHVLLQVTQHQVDGCTSAVMRPTLAEHKAGQPPTARWASITGASMVEHEDHKGPLTYYKKKRWAKDATEGKVIFDAIQELCKDSRQGRATRDGENDKDVRPLAEIKAEKERKEKAAQEKKVAQPAEGANTRCFSLGFWYDQACSWHGPIKDLLQTKQEKTTSFMIWWQKYMTSHVEPLCSAHLPKQWDEGLKKRNTAMEWIKEHWPSAGVLCPNFFSMVTVFDGYTPGSHKDDQHAEPSCLLNFGAAAWLVLPDFKVQVLLQPLDVCFLNTQQLAHASYKPVWADAASGKTQLGSPSRLQTGATDVGSSAGPGAAADKTAQASMLGGEISLAQGKPRRSAATKGEAKRQGQDLTDAATPTGSIGLCKRGSTEGKRKTKKGVKQTGVTSPTAKASLKAHGRRWGFERLPIPTLTQLKIMERNTVEAKRHHKKRRLEQALLARPVEDLVSVTLNLSIWAVAFETEVVEYCRDHLHADTFVRSWIQILVSIARHAWEDKKGHPKLSVDGAVQTIVGAWAGLVEQTAMVPAKAGVLIPAETVKRQLVDSFGLVRVDQAGGAAHIKALLV
ncbi:hypothetical protein CBOM_06278 [Ceraceosorus bombacis]|uniref:Uncharacterized protein n=1 Tax=Ceraceosorus bombacis TaxID=401625 RepID=A0A0P1BT45_9BASI|nr:hypothetical protein CBOM_06278 [Ceraceosorus bombacis]